MSQHSILAPSSAHIWAPPDGCRAYPMLSAGFPSENDCDESDEGTAAHEPAAAAANMLGNSCFDSVADLSHLLNTQASNGVTIDQDMLDGAELYAEAIRERLGPNNRPITELWTSVPSVSEHNAGTPDGVLWNPDTGELDVFDYKYGYGIVEAFENWQCINYALGWLDYLGVTGGGDEHIRIRLHVIQPRAPHRDGPVRSWSIWASDLRAYRNIFATSAAECFEPNPVARTGKHCRYCEARHVCAALGGNTKAAADYASRDFPEVTTAEEMSTELTILDDALQALKHRASGLKEQLEHAARSGAHTPGWAMEPNRPRKKWIVSKEDVFALGDALEIDLRKIEPLTPVQAEKAGIDESVINHYARRPPGALELKRDNGQKARKIFGGHHGRS